MNEMLQKENKRVTGKNKELDKELEAMGFRPSLIAVSVTSTRRYPDGNYRWTSAYYDGEVISSYSLDPRHPNMSSSEMTVMKKFELMVAKSAFIEDQKKQEKEVA